MKKIIVVLFAMVTLLSARVDVHKALSTNTKGVFISKNAELQDCIEVVIYTTENPIVLTKKDFDRDSINGGKQVKEDVIIYHIMAHHARVMYKMEASEEMIEKYIQGIMDQHGLSRDQIKAMFAQVGYSFEEGVEQLKMLYLVDTLLSYKIKSRLVLSEEAIQKEYDEHPEYTVGFYTLQTGFIPSGDITENQVKEWDKLKSSFSLIEWSDSYTLNEDEISDDRAFIKELQPQEISDLEEVVGGFEMVRLVSKSASVLKTLEERHRSIADALRAPMFEKLIKEYKHELLKEYEVVHMQ